MKSLKGRPFLLKILGILFVCAGPQGFVQASNSNESKTTAPGSVPTETTDLAPMFPEALVTLPSADGTENGLAKTALLVDKKERKLRVYEFQGDLPRLVYEVATDLGKREGDKEKTNDHKTPVGLYFLTGKKSPPAIPFDLYGKMAFETDYPNFFDRLAKKTGSGIWLHAVPDTVPLNRGSRGCVVVRNQAIEKIAEYVEPGQTPMLILHEITGLTEDQFKNHRSQYMQKIEKWRLAWEKQDLNQYFQFYDSAFRSEQMNLKKWKKHKENMKKLYGEVQVHLSQPMIVKNKDQIVIRFMQKYQSKQHQDFGEKTIVGKLNAQGELKILSEEWVPREDRRTASQQTGGFMSPSGGSVQNLQYPQPLGE